MGFCCSKSIQKGKLENVDSKKNKKTTRINEIVVQTRPDGTSRVFGKYSIVRHLKIDSKVSESMIMKLVQKDTLKTSFNKIEVRKLTENFQNSCALFTRDKEHHRNHTSLDMTNNMDVAGFQITFAILDVNFARRIFERFFDISKNGIITLHEFLIGCENWKKNYISIDDGLHSKFMFDLYDTNGDGQLSNLELIEMTNSLCCAKEFDVDAIDEKKMARIAERWFKPYTELSENNENKKKEIQVDTCINVYQNSPVDMNIIMMKPGKFRLLISVYTHGSKSISFDGLVDVLCYTQTIFGSAYRDTSDKVEKPHESIELKRKDSLLTTLPTKNRRGKTLSNFQMLKFEDQQIEDLKNIIDLFNPNPARRKAIVKIDF